MRIESSASESNNQLSLFEEVQLPKFYSNHFQLPNNYKDDTLVNEFFNEIESSNNCCFITGKVGTVKSTFIQFFTRETKKYTLLLPE